MQENPGILHQSGHAIHQANLSTDNDKVAYLLGHRSFLMLFNSLVSAGYVAVDECVPSTNALFNHLFDHLFDHSL